MEATTVERIIEGTPEFDALFAEYQTCGICHGINLIWWQCVRTNDDPRIQSYEYRAACRLCGVKTDRFVTVEYTYEA